MRTPALPTPLRLIVLLCVGPGFTPVVTAAATLELGPDFTLPRFELLPRETAGGFRITERRSPEFDATEWQVRLAAPEQGEAPLHENVRSADFVLRLPTTNAVTLHWSRGSHDAPTDFEPRTESLADGRPFALESFGGRSSDGVLPYFNLATTGGGLIVAVGWTGDWQATFESQGEGRVRVTAGMKRSRFRLRTGEEVRLPSVLVMAYRGDWLAGQNRFRRLMLREFTPKGDPLALMPVAASVHGLIGFNDTTETNLVTLAEQIGAARLPIDTYWLDAGWNPGGFPKGQGNLGADRDRFPDGLRPVSDAARRAGLRFLAWFEPERSMPASWFDFYHPEWLLAPSGTPPELRYQEKDRFRLLDLGNPEARRHIFEHLSNLIRFSGIAIYRQDCNLYPAFFWQTDEPPDRVGLREIRHVAGLYELFDQLAARHLGLILDNCASGGRRLDFEMMRRSVALWRSDSCWGAPTFPRNVQAMTHGLSLWLPLHGLGAAATDDVALRSGMGACASFAINFHDSAAIEALRRHLHRYLKVRRLFLADYQPLTPWSVDPARPLAFEFLDPAAGEGLVQVFPGTAESNLNSTPPLRGLDAASRYRVVDWNAPDREPVIQGAELMARGIPVPADRKAGAWIFELRRVGP